MISFGLELVDRRVRSGKDHQICGINTLYNNLPYVSFLPNALAERVQHHRDESAYTFIDYDVDPAGHAKTLTWSQLHQRAGVVAAELASCGSPGDRVAICAPQGLEYIVGLLGVLEAGFIAVPLSVPMLGPHDERVAKALIDSSPAAVLTTSAAVNDVVSCAQVLPGSLPAVIEIDALDLHAPVELRRTDAPQTTTALLQYTSGSTRTPAGVVVTHRNIITNLKQMMFDHYGGHRNAPPDTTVVSWLPFYHDLGLQFGIFYPIVAGLRAVLMSPMAFLQKPARWMQLLARHTRSFSGAPNFAFDLAVRRTSDDDLAGLDLGNVLSIASGAERVQAATVRRFTERFAGFNLPATALRPGYGLAEATVYVASLDTSRPPVTVRFDYEKLSAGHAERYEAEDEAGVELVSNGTPRACTMRIVNPENGVENPDGEVGEIWVHGDNVADGYWRNPQLTRQAFGAQLVDPSAGTPSGPWLRTGDLGVLFEGELFIVGRIKDLLIIDGRNHYPDDIEATIQKITAGRVAAISVPSDQSEKLVVIVEFKNRASSGEESPDRLRTVRREVTAAVSQIHSVRIADFVLVAPGSIPITTSGKIRRSTCVEHYRQDEFARLDGQAALN